jgi:septal ring factor EnvC (AmiA/AmiB activator)
VFVVIATDLFRADALCIQSELRQQLVAASGQLVELRASQASAAAEIEAARRARAELEERLRAGEEKVATMRAELEAHEGRRHLFPVLVSLFLFLANRPNVVTMTHLKSTYTK